MNEKCDGMGQCQKDKAIRDAQQEALGRAAAEQVRLDERAVSHALPHLKPATYGIAQMVAPLPSRVFTKEDVLAILRSTRGQTSWIQDGERRAGAQDAINALQDYFENA